jgi:hypothetical protein
VKLGRIIDSKDQPMGWMHYCPGCKGPHAIYVEQAHPSTGARWTFDGNQEEPTFGPSILCYTTAGKWEGKAWVPHGPRITTCHYFIRAGKIDFCGDSPHEFAGKTVPLPDLPDLPDYERDAARPPKRAPTRSAPASEVYAKRMSIDIQPAASARPARNTSSAPRRPLDLPIPLPERPFVGYGTPSGRRD